MRILVTTGNTLVPIDRVRCITNVFTGRTGTRIALHAHQQGHTVTLLSSHPELVSEAGIAGGPTLPHAGEKKIGASEQWVLHPYRTFDDLEGRMQEKITRDDLDVVIHCAAVSDYRPAGIYAPAPETQFRDGRWISPGQPALVDKTAGKVKSDEPELWLRLVRTPKLVDRIRTDWHFTGLLVKFKLEVGVNEAQLLEIAEQSRRHSGADLMVANTLEGASAWAYLGPIGETYQRIQRNQLPERLLDAVESLHQERKDG